MWKLFLSIHILKGSNWKYIQLMNEKLANEQQNIYARNFLKTENTW